MALSDAEVRRIARLARIALKDEEVAPLARELSGILAFIEQVKKLDTAQVLPMTSAVAVTLPMREDVVSEGGDPEAVLANAPEHASGYFVVPKVVE